MPYTPMTLSALAEFVASAADDRDRLRLVNEFCLEYSHEPPGIRAQLLSDRPHNDDERWRTFCEALAEHLAGIDDLDAPGWLGAVPTSLVPWWFPLGNERWQAQSLVTSPMAFRRRGIFIPSSFFEAA